MAIITINRVQEEVSASAADTLTASVKADVEVAYGQVTIGYKF